MNPVFNLVLHLVIFVVYHGKRLFTGKGNGNSALHENRAGSDNSQGIDKIDACRCMDFSELIKQNLGGVEEKLKLSNRTDKDDRHVNCKCLGRKRKQRPLRSRYSYTTFSHRDSSIIKRDIMILAYASGLLEKLNPLKGEDGSASELGIQRIDAERRAQVVFKGGKRGHETRISKTEDWKSGSEPGEQEYGTWWIALHKVPSISSYFETAQY
ncbi:uncharacterized protein I303_105215 [Kwoniella dejecticola CBS 10117]|uniref:Uncharacterized protein n=1 Tax=Kwoniella dejecticola CBS 10117 TaxID=1296121 RepID=A0A1A6A348_9TREE|nr:uncharacterized protein I303_05338 [Kwoniella dejecticola CBS 10117]OBR84480.1 hypothetical protein I303_05338 [Kwoniella dejecticola CBS 10117]